MSDDSSNRTDVSTIHLDNISLQNRDNVDTNSKFLGFDLSTQQLKAIVIDEKLKVCHQVSVDFDCELSEYKTRGGVYKSDDGSNKVTAPVNMWLKSLDLCLDKLKLDGLDFSTILAISGCAQQHGSVWWRHEAGKLLASLNPDDYLHKQLLSAFSLRDTPIWMDSSTSEQCRQLETHVGGPTRLAEITGSRAYERFTGPQIARIFKYNNDIYRATERITLVSNFLASLLIGAYAPLDASDASGMNMMDVRRKRWSDECLAGLLIDGQGDGQGDGDGDGEDENDDENDDDDKMIGSNNDNESVNSLENVKARRARELAGLRARLGCSDGAPHTLNNNIVDTHEIIGRVSHYLIERYGFPSECLISSFTGDNPGSMAGLCIKRDELILSLGTSDTAFFWLDRPQPRGAHCGHILRNPLDETQYMGLICFKNGSRTRERIRDTCCRTPDATTGVLGGWEEFGRLLSLIPRGNYGNLGYYYDHCEIYPLVKGDFRYNKLNERVESFNSPELEVRACLEGQFMRLYHHAQALGLDMSQIRRVLVTGGASVNRPILQVIADIFKSPVYTLESIANSACLGGAYLAKYAYELEQQKLDQSFSQTASQLELVAMNEEAEQEEEEEEEEEKKQEKNSSLDNTNYEVTSNHLLDQTTTTTTIGQQAFQTKATLNTLSGAESLQSMRAEKQVDFGQMILGASAAMAPGEEDENCREINLVKMAEPAPIGAHQVDVYDLLLERYVRFETEIARNNQDLELGFSLNKKL